MQIWAFRGHTQHVSGDCRSPAGLHVSYGRIRVAFYVYTQGDLDAAESHLRQAIPICDDVWPAAAGAFRGSLALVRARRGAFDEARDLFAKGEAQVRGVYALELGKLICKKARVEHMAGEPDAAAAALAEAEAIATNLGGGSDSELARALSDTRRVLSR